jgi:hypothetical protein
MLETTTHLLFHWPLAASLWARVSKDTGLSLLSGQDTTLATYLASKARVSSIYGLSKIAMHLYYCSVAHLKGAKPTDIQTAGVHFVCRFPWYRGRWIPLLEFEFLDHFGKGLFSRFLVLFYFFLIKSK